MTIRSGTGEGWACRLGAGSFETIYEPPEARVGKFSTGAHRHRNRPNPRPVNVRLSVVGCIETRRSWPSIAPCLGARHQREHQWTHLPISTQRNQSQLLGSPAVRSACCLTQAWPPIFQKGWVPHWSPPIASVNMPRLNRRTGSYRSQLSTGLSEFARHSRPLCLMPAPPASAPRRPDSALPPRATCAWPRSAGSDGSISRSRDVVCVEVDAQIQ